VAAVEPEVVPVVEPVVEPVVVPAVEPPVVECSSCHLRCCHPRHRRNPP
jgi:hypothetical protein